MKRQLGQRLALVAMTSASLLLTGAPAHAETPPRHHEKSVRTAGSAGPYQILMHHSLKCVDNPGYSRRPGEVIQQHLCKIPTSVNADNQRWTFDWTDNGYARIRNVFSGMCLNVKGASTSPRAEIIQWPCGAAPAGNDQWKGIKFGRYPIYFRGVWQEHDFFRLHVRNAPPSGPNDLDSGMCLHVEWASQQDGGRFVLWPCGDEAAPDGNDRATWF